jgi:hypothetical protein
VAPVWPWLTNCGLVASAALTSAKVVPKYTLCVAAYGPAFQLRTTSLGTFDKWIFPVIANMSENDVIDQLVSVQPMPGPVTVNALKRDIDVDYRDFAGDQEPRIAASGWSSEAQQVFRDEVERMRGEGRTSARSVLQAWRLGDVAFASLPGEAFVDLGIRIKSRSPFPWTYAVENGGDWLGYLVTEEAWRAGGYESLVSRVAKPTHEAASAMVDGAVALLTGLHQPQTRAKRQSS